MAEFAKKYLGGQNLISNIFDKIESFTIIPTSTSSILWTTNYKYIIVRKTKACGVGAP